MYHHPTRSLRVVPCLSRTVVAKAYQEAESLFAAFRRVTSEPTEPLRDSPVSPLLPFLKPQECKIHFQATLTEMDNLRRSSAMAEAHESIKSILLVEECLRRIALNFLDDLIAMVPSALSLRNDIEKKSVFRMWAYYEGGECRPHYDPGICTALLSGSSEGLAVNFVDTLSATNTLGDYTAMQNGTEANAHLNGSTNWVRAKDLLASAEVKRLCTDDETECALVMADTTTQVITGGEVKHVLHCVMDDDDLDKLRGKQGPRINIILELRPKGKWYDFSPSDDERTSLRRRE